MSDIETVITASKQIEKLLEMRFGAKGRGLHDKLTSVQNQLPDHIVKRARFIASVRNAVVHGDEPMIRDRAGFENATQEVSSYLRENWPKARTGGKTRVRYTGRTRRHRTRNTPATILVVGLVFVIYALVRFATGE